MKWSFFVGACILTSMLLVAYHVPVPAIAAGIALAAFWNWRKRRKVFSNAQGKSKPPE